MSAATQSVVLVYSTSHAIRLEKLLKAGNIPCKLIPVPRHLSSDCGVCVRFDDAHRAAIDHAVETSGMEIQGIAAVST
jgi:hypothetical protein